MNFLDLYHEVKSQVSPGKAFLIGNEELSYSQLFDQVEKLNTYLKEKKLSKGCKVLVSTQYASLLAPIYLALAINGYCTVLVDPEAHEDRVKSLQSRTKASLLLADEESLKEWKNIKDCTSCISLLKPGKKKRSLFSKLLRKKAELEVKEDQYPSCIEQYTSSLPSTAPQSDAFAHMLFTSGTLADPKGVPLSQDAVLYHLQTLKKHLAYDKNTCLLNVLPIYHTDGLVHGLLTAFFNQASICRPFTFSVQRIGELLDSIYRERITHWITVPSLLALSERLGSDYLEAFQTDEFKFVVSSADNLDSNLWERFEKLFSCPIVNVYGLTETVVGGLFSGPDTETRKIGSIGKAIDCEACLLDIEDGIGELALRGRHISKSYFENPEATDAAYCDDWFRTGDLARLDEEGYYYFIGRKKNVLISGGRNIYPEEIVEVLSTQKEVEEAAVWGLKDEVWGQVPVGYVSIREGMENNEANMIEYCRKHLPRFKVPKRIYLVPKIPRGHSGKIQVTQLQTIAEKAESRALPSQNISEQILQIASNSFVCSKQNLRMDMGPNSIPGWDSMAHLDFATSLESAFSIRLEGKEIMRIESLHDAEELVKHHLGSMSYV